MAHPRGFEPLTARFVAEYSIQLSYGCRINKLTTNGGERGIRTLDGVLTPYSLSRGAPSAYSAISPHSVCGRYNTFLKICQIIFEKRCWLLDLSTLCINKGAVEKTNIFPTALLILSSLAF